MEIQLQGTEIAVEMPPASPATQGINPTREIGDAIGPRQRPGQPAFPDFACGVDSLGRRRGGGHFDSDFVSVRFGSGRSVSFLSIF